MDNKWLLPLLFGSLAVAELLRTFLKVESWMAFAAAGIVAVIVNVVVVNKKFTKQIKEDLEKK